jgi:hypothetical protein
LLALPPKREEISMALDEQVRHSAEALASDLGRELQQRLGQFVDQLLQEAATERDALTAQAAQFAADAEARLETAVAEARAETAAEHDAAIARLSEASEAEVAAAIDRTRAALAEESSATLAAAILRAREEAASEASAMVARARDEVAEASAQLQADQDARQAEVDRAALERQRDEREAMLGEMERLVDSFRKLDATTSLSALLDALAEAAAQEAPRTALLIVRSRELQGWSFSGFVGAPSEPRKLTIPLDARGDLARVIDTRARVEVSSAASPAVDSPAFDLLTPAAGDVGVAVPVTVGDHVSALLYADDGGDAERMVPASWPETLELLARHAARCLEAQTAIRAAGLGVGSHVAARSSAPAGVGQLADSQEEAAARRYARLVVSDIRLAHEPAVRVGREERDLGERLRDQIDRARETYQQRVPAALSTRDRLFDEELVRTLADGDASLLSVAVS